MPMTLSPLIKKTALTLAIILFIFSAGLFYVNKILLPVQVKAMAVKAAEDALHRKVVFDTLQYDPWHGLVITGISVSEKDDPARPFIQANAVSVQVLLPALLQKKLVITALRIEAPHVTLTRLEQARWNFSDLIAAPAPAAAPAPSAPGMDIAITSFAIEDGVIDVSDSSPGGPFQETVNIPAIRGSFALTGTFHVAGKLLFPATQGTIDLDTRLSLTGKDVKGNVQIKNIVPVRYLRFSPVALPVEARSLTIASADITAALKDDVLSLSGDVDLPGLDIRLPDGSRMQGDISLSKISAAVKANDITLAGSLAGNTLKLRPSSGPRLTLNSLRVPDVKIALKDGELKASGAIHAKEFLVALETGEEIKGNFDLASAVVTQKDKAIHASADIKISPMTCTLDKDRSVTADIAITHAAAAIEGAAVQAKADIDVTNAALTFPDIKVTTNMAAPDTRINIDTGRIDAGVQATFKDFSAKSKDITVSGDPHLAAHVVFNPQAATPLAYTGTLRLPGLALAGLPSVGAIKDLNSEITFETDNAQIKALDFTVLATPVHVSGKVAHFTAPVIDIAAACPKVELALIEKFIPDIVREQGLAVKGTAAIDVAVKGPLASFSTPQNAKVHATVRLADVSVESKKLDQSVTALSGLIDYTTPTLTWKDVTASYRGKQWTTHGYVQDPSEPFIAASLKTTGLSADIKAKKKGDTVTIETLNGTYADSSFEIKGSVLIPAGKGPRVDLNSDCSLALKDISSLLPPEQAKQIDALKLAGTLKITASVKGDPQQWQDLDSTIAVEAPTVKVMGYQIGDLAVNAAQKNGKVDPLTANATVYGGSLTSTTTIALKDKGMPFNASIKLADTDLALLKQDTPLKQQQLSGKLSSTAQFKGELLHALDLTGTTTVKISSGYLWDLAILSKVLTVLSSSFQGGDIIITDADATLDIHEQKVWTNNLTLRSASVTLLGTGWIGFDQTIDMSVTPRLEVSAGSATTSPLALINPTEGLVNIRITNTLSAPKIDHDISAPQVIKKTLQNTVGSILKLFE